MRAAYVTLGAQGNSPWIPIDYLQNAFGVGIGVWLSEDGNLTYSVQHTFDDPSLPRTPIKIARVAGTATVTFPWPHGLTTADSIIVMNSGSTQLDSQLFTATNGSPGNTGGQAVGFDIASTPTTTTLTYACTNAGPTSDGGNAEARVQRAFNHISLVAQSARNDGNYAFPVMAVRLKCNSFTAGLVTMAVVQGLGR